MFFSYVESYVVQTVPKDLTFSFSLFRLHAELRLKRQKDLQAFYFGRNGKLQYNITL